MNKKTLKAIFILTFLISILIVISACAGIFGKETYIRETPNWRIQSIGQDKINLFIIVPLLLISGIKSFYIKTNYLFIFGGCLLFLIYTFTIYCFTIHFNSLFLVYCAVLGLSFYTFTFVVYKSYQLIGNDLFRIQLPVRSLRIFLILMASIFSFLWLREDVTAILLTVPSVTLTEAGLFTNPVHVLDLAIILPGFFIMAYLLKKGISLGKLLVNHILVFCVLMEINIAGLVIMMNPDHAGYLSWVTGFMFLSAAISILLALIVFRRLKIIQPQ